MKTKYRIGCKEIFTALVGFAFLYLFVFSVFYIIREGNKETVDWKLALPPDEKNRITNPDGMSIICPVGWKFSIDADVISMSGQTPSNRQVCTILVSQLNDSEIPEKIMNDISFKQTVYQNEIAFEKITTKKGTGIENPSRISGERYFLRYGQCYCIFYYFGLCETLPLNAHLYFDSFSTICLSPPEIKPLNTQNENDIQSK